MSHLLVDGYNLLYLMDPAIIRTLEQRRNKLLEKLRLYQEQKGVDLTIVFDGAQAPGPLGIERSREGNVTVIFSHEGETADQWIADECRKNPGQYVVVSSDNEVIFAAERNQCVSVSSHEFLKRLTQALEWRSDPDYFSEKDDSGPLYPKVSTRKKGVAKRPSKRERRKLTRLKNL
jgi:predicted RNA-binding protein with PIN domain